MTAAGATAGAAAAGSAGTVSSIGSTEAMGTGTGGGAVISMTPGDPEASAAFSRIRPDDDPHSGRNSEDDAGLDVLTLRAGIRRHRPLAGAGGFR